MFTVYFLTITVILTGLFVKYFGNALWFSRKLPGPPALPLIGNALLFINKSPTDFIDICINLLMTYGRCIRVWLGPELHAFLADPKDVEIILTSQKVIDKSDDYSMIFPWLGDGLLLSTGKKWFARRKAITPTFHFKILEQFVEIFHKQGNIFVDCLRQKTLKDESFDIYPLVTLCALDVICESAMGASINAQINSESEYVLAVKELAHIMHIRMFDVPMRYDILFYLSSNYNRQKNALKVVHDFTDSVIIQRRQELLQLNMQKQNNNEMKNEIEDDVGIKKKMAFLDVLLQSTVEGKPLTNIDIREEVDTFMFEGHDTTTSAICFALYNLAKYPEAQKKVFDEVTAVFANHEGVPTLRQLNELNYTELVIKETLRLFPSVPIIARKIKENIDINGKIIPSGTNLIISPFVMGRDPDTYDAPENFIPERFDVLTSADTKNPFAYIPFSAGPRNCIGQKFAMYELKSMISKVVKAFELSLPEVDYEPIIVAELILRPESGIKLKVKPRAK